MLHRPPPLHLPAYLNLKGAQRRAALVDALNGRYREEERLACGHI